MLLAAQKKRKDDEDGGVGEDPTEEMKDRIKVHQELKDRLFYI